MCGRYYYGTGFEPRGDYPNLLGITPADRRPKLQGLRAETYILDEAPIDNNIDLGDPFGDKTAYIKTPIRKEEFNVDDFEEFDIRKNLFKQLFDKVKLKPPTFEEFCKGVRLNVMYNPATFCRTYNLTYFDNEVGNIIANVAVSEIDLLDERVHSEDIQNAIEEEKLNMYTKLNLEYNKKNKEATINEEKKMINIPGMNEREVRALVDGLNEICYDVSVKWEDTGFGVVKSILRLELPVEKARYLKVACQSIVKQSSKSGWIEGIPAVKKVETYNQRVVKVTFIDDTFTKSVCSENDHFDIDVGIMICLLKRILGTNGDDATRNYNKLMNQVHAVMEKNEKERLSRIEEEKTLKAKKRKIELKRAAKKLKAKEEQIDIQKQAIIRAHQEMEGLEQ